MENASGSTRPPTKVAGWTRPSRFGVRLPPWLRSVKTILAIQLLIALAVVFWFRPAYEQTQRDNRHSAYGKLKALALQLHWYCKAGEYRPRYLANGVYRQSRFAFSWRLEIMRREDPVDFSDVTNGIAQAQTLTQVQASLAGRTTNFSSPRCPDSIGTDRTAFAAVIDQDTVVQAGKLTAIDEIVDGADHTGMLLELMRSDIDWWESRDLTIDEAIAEIQRCPLPSGLLVAMANGRVVGIPPETPPAEIRKLFTMSDGIPNINYRKPFELAP